LIVREEVGQSIEPNEFHVCVFPIIIPPSWHATMDMLQLPQPSIATSVDAVPLHPALCFFENMVGKKDP
jgi:hypothetical protein